ncbi:NAD(P)H-hydrate dehydratase [Rhizorhabdus argentea]|uniref:NAD(P)H-hydrate dehydratase n=1 Tax=Rhizorhabdus argentea TaxID=1387174 RepID=UPI0030ED2048
MTNAPPLDTGRTNATPLDAAWRAAHPLPGHGQSTDKNARGRVLLVGGSRFVPGALGLTGEAVLRAGAGKLQIATVDDAAMHLGVLVPEAAMIGLPTDDDGEIAPDAAAGLVDAARYCDTLLLGPGMVSQSSARALIKGLFAELRDEQIVILDAAAIACAADLREIVAARNGRVIMTPHHGEMGRLTGCEPEQIAADPVGSATAAARAFGAAIVLKAGETIIAAPDGKALLYDSDCIGLATGGSGDVLAGIMAGLAARGADPVTAAGWGVWLHGQAGQAAAARIGPIGFLARDLPREVPRLMAPAGDGQD